MPDNDRDHPDTTNETGGEHLPEFNPDDFGDSTRKKPRREPVFSGFEEEDSDEKKDSYEEPDQGANYTSSYREEDLENIEFNELPRDPDDFTPQADMEWDEPEQISRHDATTSEEEEEGDEDDEQGDEWSDEEGYYEEDDGDFQRFPLSLVVVGLVALLLLAAGGYGVIQQRSAAQEEIRELQATLATSANPATITASRDTVRKEQDRNTELLAAMEALTLENQRLTNTVAGLESRLEAQQVAATELESRLEAQQIAAAKQAAAPKPVAAPAAVKPEPQPATPKSTPPVATGGGTWFVNFSSYDQRATAENWATKLKPTAGKVVVTTGDKAGATVYRVRVIKLASRQSAEKIARQLEREYGLTKLWVGQQ